MEREHKERFELAMLEADEIDLETLQATADLFDALYTKRYDEMFRQTEEEGKVII